MIYWRRLSSQLKTKTSNFTYHFPSLFFIMGIGSATILPKLPKLETEAALYKFSLYTWSEESNLLSVFPSAGIKTTGMLNRLESPNFDTNSNSGPFCIFSSRLGRYKFSADLVLSDMSILRPFFGKSKFSLLSSFTAGVGGITGNWISVTYTYWRNMFYSLLIRMVQWHVFYKQNKRYQLLKSSKLNPTNINVGVNQIYRFASKFDAD